MGKKSKKSEKQLPEKIEMPNKEVKASKPTMSFEAWFQSKLAEKKVKYWQDYTLSVFFEKQGLGLEESKEAYDKCFEKF